MKIFKKKVPAKRIALLRKAVNLRGELEERVRYIEKMRLLFLRGDIDSEQDLLDSFNDKGRSLACYDIPMIDLLGKLRDNTFLRIYRESFVSHISEYLSLLKQGKYFEAIKLNKEYKLK